MQAACSGRFRCLWPETGCQLVPVTPTLCVKRGVHISRAALRKLVPEAGPKDHVQALSNVSSVITDDAVPEGHKGLHGFLYGEGGAEQHAVVSAYNFREVGANRPHVKLALGFP